MENVKTYNKTISVASIISNEIVQETIIKQSQLEQNLDGFKATVSATYQTKDDMGNYVTTKAMNSAIEQKANQITSTVSETYAKKDDITSITDNIGDYMVNISKSTILLTSDLDGNITN